MKNDKPVETIHKELKKSGETNTCKMKPLQTLFQTTAHLANIMEQFENLSVKIQDILWIKEQTENLKLKVKNRYKVLAHDKSI